MVFVQIVNTDAALLEELLPAADHLDVVPRIGAPDGDRVAPVAVAADRPVPGALEPLAKTPLLQVSRHPVNLVVGAEHARLDLVDIDEPGADRTVDQRLLRAIAEGVRVTVGLSLDKNAPLFEPGDDRLVRFLYLQPFEIRHLGGKTRFCVDRYDYREPAPLRRL
jgi:hypothetical protein